MGKLARLVDGIVEKLLAGAGAGAGKKEKAAASYGKMGKTDSMRVEMRSRRARQLVAKNLALADAIAGPRTAGADGNKKKKKKKRFFAF